MELKMRQFETGATRNTDDNKPDYEGFLSPLVLQEYAMYMHKHRMQVDGQLRASDNWQKGMPLPSYMKSLWRHFMDTWLMHRDNRRGTREQMKEALCGILFNTQGYLHELLVDEEKE